MLFLAKQPEWRQKGDFNLDESRVRESDSPNLLYAGIALYHPSILEGAVVEKFSIVPRLKAIHQDRRVAGQLINGEWDDVALPTDWPPYAINTANKSERLLRSCRHSTLS